jgi:hypothetical protein
MNSSEAYRIKIITDETVAEDIRAYAAQQPGIVKVVSEDRDEDPTRLGYNLTEIFSVVAAVAKAAVESFTLATKISEWLKKSKANKIIIQFPGQMLEFTKSSEISKEEIQKLLQAAVALNR